QQIKSLIPDFWIADADLSLEQAVLQLMEEQQLSLSVAESCTGGFISHLFTQHAGSSSVFDGGAVVYSNKLKQSLLGVKEATLNRFGAVSEETVKEMVEGALENFSTD